MRNLAFKALSTASLVFTLASHSGAQGQGGEIAGTVADSTGAVIVGAHVTLRETSGAPLQNATTDGRGRYSLTGVARGNYTLFVFRDGFAPLTEELRVDDAAVSRDFVLKVAGFAEEMTVSFTGEQARTALKMEAAVRDIPLSIKSYGNSFIKALDAKTVDDTFTYMNGVDKTGNGIYDINIRGFSTTIEGFNIQTNGMPGSSMRFNSANISNVERMEVLKGPASVLYGRASPGGVLNIITKRPQDERRYLADMRFGSFTGGTGPSFGDANSYRLAADLTGPLGSSHRLLYRLIGSYENSHSFRDFVTGDEVFVAPSLTWRTSGKTTLTLEGEYRRVTNSMDDGLIAPLNDINFVAPISTRYQEPGDIEHDNGWGIAAYFTADLGGGWGWNANWRSVLHEDDRTGFESRATAIARDSLTVRRRDRDQVNGRDLHFLDSTLLKTLRTGGVSHALLMGLGGGYEFRENNRRRFGATGFAVDLNRPLYGLYARPPTPAPSMNRVFDRWNYNIYVQDRVDFSPRWKGLASLRYDLLQTDMEERRLTEDPLQNPDPPFSREDDAWIPTVGLVFQPDTRWSLYGSFATSFETTQNIAAATAAEAMADFDPITGRQFETGVKADLARSRVEAALALYHITRNNVLVRVGPETTQRLGQERSQGLEIDLRMKPADHFQAILGYAYTDSIVTKDTNPVRVGSRSRNSSKHAFNVWARYDFPSDPIKGLGFGIGIIRRGDRAGSLPSDTLAPAIPGQPVPTRVLLLPGYVRLDAGLYFVRSRYEITLRINNLTDKLYYESARSDLEVRPGRPREATLSLRVRI